MNRGYKTSEFYGTVLVFFLLAYGQYLHPHEAIWMQVMTAISCSFSISRAFFKKNRGSLLYPAWKTTEFYFFIFTLLILSFFMFKKIVDFKTGLICLAASQIAWNISRGYAKSLEPVQHRTTVL